MRRGLSRREQGFRVHDLTNLWACRARRPRPGTPDLLLSALLEMADELANCSAEHRPALASREHKRLNERATAKRAWKSWTRQDLQSINLTASHIKKLIEALGRRVPSEPARLPLVLSQLLSETCDGAASSETRRGRDSPTARFHQVALGHAMVDAIVQPN
jgi:hypothetical protein